MNSRDHKDFREEDFDWALGNYALEFDGHCAAGVVPYDEETRKHFYDDFQKYFYLPKDKLLIRTQLFMLQRWFGKWGGEQTPIYDRDYSLYFLLYLEVYRYHFPLVFKSNFDYHDCLPKDANEMTLENLAGAIRRHFAGETRPTLTDIDFILDNYFSSQACGFLEDKHLLSRPEVILAASINPILATNLLLRSSSESTSNFKADLSYARCQEAKDSFGRELTAMLKDLKFFQDDTKNLLFLYILQAWLSRHPSCVDTLSTEYVLLMFLYLHLYRIEFPEYLMREPFFSQWKSMAKSRKEDTAEHFRKKLCVMRENRLQNEKQD